ncbi:hypothetical protein PBCV1_a594R [Paramecium bursaria Chlorella virus 1]|uniref:Uncharacterized protein n=1 Tax=Paramecium bursaria Chlorella virus 1 TaxID=10506 RepID=O41076_PBCV1|nr:hypothetical protein PBCV1_a594R [Paramecium bursaria Chlorella virus 1]AAC96935.2 hypothetical protein [Paramecium bursaria Chlorella virus 1]
MTRCLCAVSTSHHRPTSKQTHHLPLKLFRLFRLFRLLHHPRHPLRQMCLTPRHPLQQVRLLLDHLQPRHQHPLRPMHFLPQHLQPLQLPQPPQQPIHFLPPQPRRRRLRRGVKVPQ